MCTRADIISRQSRQERHTCLRAIEESGGGAGDHDLTYLESSILLHHGSEVDGDEEGGLGRNLVALNGVHKRLLHRQLLDGLHVEAVHVVPEVQLLMPATSQSTM